jgi:alkylated DNA repair dioxygenase AlkB
VTRERCNPATAQQRPEAAGPPHPALGVQDVAAGPPATTKAPPPHRHETPPAQDLLHLHGKLYPPARCSTLLDTLISDIRWQYDYLAFGRRFDVPRVQAWYADPGVHYRYSNNLLNHQAWIEPLQRIRQDVEQASGHSFNSVLVTYYRDGRDHVTLHADDEPELGEAPVIASLSLGARRRFEYRPKSGGEPQGMSLHDGDLLIMQPAFQRDWLHCVPAEPTVTGPRINLTFRRVYMRRG